MNPIDPKSFVTAVKPLLESRDLQGLCRVLRERWTPRQITDLLSDHDGDVRKIAALSLGMVGGRRCVGELARQLRDPDRVVNEMAEHALWSIWFRLGEPAANNVLLKGLDHLNRREMGPAEESFARAIELDPKFAEAYNQRAIVRYFTERYEQSIADCRKVVELMPEHFGAWAGMGHCHAHLGHADEAVENYERALEINPHLDCVRQSIAELKGT